MKYPRIAQMIIGEPLMVSPSLMAAGVRFANAALQGNFDSQLFHEPHEQQPSPAQRERLSVVNGVAFIKVHGPIVSRIGHLDACEQMVAIEKLSREFQAALADEGVLKICFDIDTGGGTPVGTFEFAEDIYNARSQKQTVALIHHHAYSAGYLIAAACSEVHVSETSGTGSIGVIAEHVDWSKYLDDLGAKTTTLYKGSHKNDLSPNEPITEQSMQVLNDRLENLYTMFVERVAKYRNLSTDQVKATEAAVYMGQEGVAVGLADTVGPLQAKVDSLASQVNDAEVIGMTSDKAQPSAILDEFGESEPELSTELTRLLPKGRVARAASAMGKRLKTSGKKLTTSL